MRNRYKLTNTITGQVYEGDAYELSEVMNVDKYYFWCLAGVGSYKSKEWKIEHIKHNYKVYKYVGSYEKIGDIAKDMNAHYGSLANAIQGSKHYKDLYIEVEEDGR